MHSFQIERMQSSLKYELVSCVGCLLGYTVFYLLLWFAVPHVFLEGKFDTLIFSYIIAIAYLGLLVHFLLLVRRRRHLEILEIACRLAGGRISE